MQINTTITPQLLERFWNKVSKTGACWLWIGSLQRKGYGTFRVSNGPHPHRRAHRLSWEIQFGPIPEDLHVLHKCDNPRCVNPEHLFLGTNLDNMNDREAKGRGAKGERSGRSKHPERYPDGEDRSTAKLSDSQVAEIRAKYIPGSYGFIRLAREYGVSSSHINSIICGRKRKKGFNPSENNVSDKNQFSIAGRRKFTPEQVRDIRTKRSKGVRYCEIQREFKCNTSDIRKIELGITYKFVG